ncbi:MAG: bifunctional folylpolyglutamate synthase/dihydrofolate synthase [Thermoflexaceae bacterium]|nr:bifunctional folylpolyglutamate synthase/dihydrofolate synthase [Thermoflexaceae bacterium]
MTFSEAMDYINAISKKGSVLGLDTTRELLRRIGNPQDKLKFVHIAGTNGKGSVLAFISTILAEAGYRTGRYISPVIYQYCEKIQINGEYISTQAVAAIVEVLKKACDAMVRDGFEQPTVFEVETAMAFLYFLNEGCDIVVLETGMGGRDDSTNVIQTPVCEVLTSISLEHVGIIGNNLAEITECKAGIIKDNSNVVLYAQSDEVTEIIQKICEDRKCSLTVTKPEQIIRKEDSLEGQIFDYGEHKDIYIRLLGEYQLKNAAAALEVIDVLRNNNYNITDTDIKNGMEHTSWSGRFEIVNSRPLIIMDGAHNPDGARVFADTVKEYLDDYIKIFVMGVLRDKDYPSIIKLTNDLASAIITINPDNARALSDTELKDAINEIKERDIPVIAAGRIEGGIEMASQIAIQLGHEKTAIIVFGSLSFLGDLGRYLYQ